MQSWLDVLHMREEGDAAAIVSPRLSRFGLRNICALLKRRDIIGLESRKGLLTTANYEFRGSLLSLESLD
jgi:hypothetical protein